MPREPVKPGQVFGDVLFPDKDTQNTGRPIRMVMMSGTDKPPTVWELGGYELKPLILLCHKTLTL
jgi:hypothetical protein